MSSVVMKSFQELAGQVANFRQEATAPLPSALLTGRNKRKAGDAAPRPKLQTSAPIQESLEKLAAVLDQAFSVRGLPGMLSLGDHAVRSIAGSIKDPTMTEAKLPLRALEQIAISCGAGITGQAHATRGRRLLQMLSEVPAVTPEGLVRVINTPNGPDLKVVEKIKDASTALAVFTAFCPIDEDLIGRLEIAKSTKLASLRQPHMIQLRKMVPDIGAALTVAVIGFMGYDAQSNPVVNLVRTNFPTLTWMENTIKDARNILGEEDEFLRGEIYCNFVEEPVELADYAQLAAELSVIRVDDGAPSGARAKANQIYLANKAHYDELKAKWTALQNGVDEIQAEAVRACDDILALIRFKKAEKEWKRSMERGEDREPVQKAGRRKEKNAEPVTPAAPKTSIRTPDEAAAIALEGNEIEVELGIPHFNAAALGLTEVERKVTLAGAGLDGGRECAAYPGVVWEAVFGPLDHAMDIERVESDCRMVVIAPRRPGGLGLDLTEARVLLVGEYEDYFTPVDAH